ncbi:MAG: S8 family serine peptidase [Chloroflexi bacterium]|nr:S8 family serine peptidase [Chloroflexota bacterium]
MKRPSQIGGRRLEMGMNARRLSACLVLLLLASSVLVGSAGASGPNSDNDRVKVIIGFDRQPGPNEEALVRAGGGSIKYTYHLIPAIAASIPPAAIDGLLRNPLVLRIEPDIAVRAIGELEDSWGVLRIGAGIVHSDGNKGTGVKVAIIDSGVDYRHPDLDANYAGGYDFVNGDNDPMDDNGHGTHVAGTIAAEANGSGVVGAAPEARIYALKVLAADGGGSYSNVIAALQWAVDNGIQVTNNSYGSSGDPGTLTKAAFDNAYAAGVLHIAAAGNSGNPPGRGDNVIYPARYMSVVAVAATDSNNNRANFSSTGPDVEIAAPGVGIKSTVPNGGYAVYSGTSMASPHVAGTAALVIKSGIADLNGDGKSNNEDVRLKLQQTADDLGPGGRDPYYGFGLVDADEAAIPPTGRPSVSITSPANGSTFHVNQSITFTGTASDPEDGDVTASLVWTSSINGQIGTGGSFAVSLSEGSHTITATATDSGGNTGSASVSITVVNDAPVVAILQPVNGATFSSGTSITFEGTASDTEDGSLTSSLAWTSSKDGAIGTGGIFARVLSDGSHTITARATDSSGKTGSASIGITVGSPPSGPTTVKVASIGYTTEGGKSGDQHLRVTVALVDDLGNPVANAAVSIDLLRDNSPYLSATGTTGADGKVSFKANNAPSGTYSTKVTSVTAAGLTWDGITPSNQFVKN